MSDEVKKIERFLNQQYKKAQKDVEKKLKKYIKQYKELDKRKKKEVKEGKITEDEYNQWRVNKILYGVHWQKLLENISADMLRTNELAVKYINGKVPDIFINAYNSLERDIPVGPVEGYSFELVNKDVVEQLVRSGEIMLPPPKDINKYKDQMWNKKNVNSAMLQGILQGEEIDEIATRVATATAEKNFAVARRNARTMVTAAENSGRAAGIKRAEQDGVILDKIWLAARDDRTRDSHAAMNGERIPSEKPFSNGLMFPGDWNTKNPAEVYNCRCTLVTKFVSFDNKRYKESFKNRISAQNEGSDTHYGSNGKAKSNKASKNNPKIIEKPSVTNDIFNDLVKQVRNKMAYIPMTYHTTQPSESEIIAALSGDETDGSCASVALAYIGQKLGINVLDYRDGKSRVFFATSTNLKRVLGLPGIINYRDTGKSSYEIGLKLLGLCEEGKEYLLCVGEHASIVRRNEEGKMQYLELQRRKKIGWHNLNTISFISRFGVGMTKLDSDKIDDQFMINISDSNFGDDFKYLLGYLNTKEGKKYVKK